MCLREGVRRTPGDGHVRKGQSAILSKQMAKRWEPHACLPWAGRRVFGNADFLGTQVPQLSRDEVLKAFAGLHGCIHNATLRRGPG